jgi:hypothetical protein
LNWIIDLYESVDEIRANEQTIVYTVHPTVGHLGIFVSAKVALKEHAEFVDSLDLIETLAPGLYEMVIEEEHIEAKGKPAEHTAYNVRFVARSFEDILAYDDGREDEAPFRTLAKVSETNQGLYRQLVSPWVRAMVTPQVAEAMRLMHPLRQAQIWASDFNPWMAGIKWAAEQVRENRQALPADDAFRATEEAIVKRTEEAIEAWTEARDRMVEQLFKATWNQPWIRALVGEEASFADVRKPRARRDKAFRELAALKLRALGARESKGSFAEAIMRVVYAATKAAGGVDARAYVAAREIWRRHPRLLAKLDRRSFLAEAKEAALMVAFDEEQALASLPQLLPTAEERREAVDLLRQMAAWRAEMMPEIESLLDRVEAILAVAPAAGKVASEPVNAAALEVAAEPESSEARPAETPATVPAAAPTTAKEKVVAVPRRTPDPRRPSARRTNKTTS